MLTSNKGFGEWGELMGDLCLLPQYWLDYYIMLI
ncbi:MAG: hypothetical protein QJR05_13260 [Thermoanaerobacterium sp.]|nr:hypothetical protein [Thermoanaerobacterium sp.]